MAVGSLPVCHAQSALAAHQVKNALSTPSKPSACPVVIWLKDSAGSITLSSTMALMWVGKSAA